MKPRTSRPYWRYVEEEFFIGRHEPTWLAAYAHVIGAVILIVAMAVVAWLAGGR